jgi:hypothetical protein
VSTDAQDLTDEQVAHYRQVLAAHAGKPELGGCPVCGVPRCPDWTTAYDMLAAAHQVMTESPPPWKPFRPGRKPNDVNLST